MFTMHSLWRKIWGISFNLHSVLHKENSLSTVIKVRECCQIAQIVNCKAIPLSTATALQCNPCSKGSKSLHCFSEFKLFEVTTRLACAQIHRRVMCIDNLSCNWQPRRLLQCSSENFQKGNSNSSKLASTAFHFHTHSNTIFNIIMPIFNSMSDGSWPFDEVQIRLWW